MFGDCRVYDIEKRIKTPSKYLFPSFETTHWYAAKHVLDTIKGQSIRYSRHAYSEHTYSKHAYIELTLIVKWFSFPVAFKHLWTYRIYNEWSLKPSKITHPCHFVISMFYCIVSVTTYWYMTWLCWLIIIYWTPLSQRNVRHCNMEFECIV